MKNSIPCNRQVFQYFGSKKMKGPYESFYLYEMNNFYTFVCSKLSNLFLGLAEREGDAIPKHLKSRMLCICNSATWWPGTYRSKGPGIRVYSCSMSEVGNCWKALLSRIENPYLFDCFLYSKLSNGYILNACAIGHEYDAYYVNFEGMLTKKDLNSLGFFLDKDLKYEDLVRRAGEVCGK